MYISEHMTPDPITVSSEVLLPEARQILNENLFRHLPVIDNKRRLVGIITDRDLRSAYPSSVATKSERMLVYGQVEKTIVADIMSRSCSTLGLQATIDDALLIFDRDKVGGIPVISEEGVVVGIFSMRDLTAAYRKLFGVGEKGSLFVGVEDDGVEHIMSRIVLLLEENSIPLSRLIRLERRGEEGKIYMRVNSRNPNQVLKLLVNNGFNLIMP
ncbi:MAG: CBS domain-containing protein [Deltaproteobacteria bacterium]|nr:CBS domain-containing protein [Deltaproteobacteria bacterium]MBW2658208.1 CBS domain-containing protein [Deltaproteobacteria bacterium]